MKGLPFTICGIARRTWRRGGETRFPATLLCNCSSASRAGGIGGGRRGRGGMTDSGSTGPTSSGWWFAMGLIDRLMD